MTSTKTICISLFLAIFLLQHCKPTNPHELVSPTTGRVSILADENLKEIIEQEQQAFESTYKYAKLDIRYAPEYHVIDQFFQDSVHLIFTTRRLNAAELEYLKKRAFYPKQTHFATGALAFVNAKTNKDTTVSYEQLIAMLKDSSSGVQFVIENARSGIANQILGALGSDQLPSHFFAQRSKQEVLKYVTTHTKAIGIIDYSDISDSDAAYSKEVLDLVNLLAISRPKDSLQMGFLRPFQYNLQDKRYPFTRELYCIDKSGRNNVGAGFSAYVAGHIGQKIVLKAGLLPEYQSARWIELISNPKPTVVK